MGTLVIEAFVCLFVCLFGRVYLPLPVPYIHLLFSKNDRLSNRSCFSIFRAASFTCIPSPLHVHFALLPPSNPPIYTHALTHTHTHVHRPVYLRSSSPSRTTISTWPPHFSTQALLPTSTPPQDGPRYSLPYLTPPAARIPARVAAKVAAKVVATVTVTTVVG